MSRGKLHTKIFRCDFWFVAVNKRTRIFRTYTKNELIAIQLLTSSRNWVLAGNFLDNRFEWFLVETIPFIGHILCEKERKQIAISTWNSRYSLHKTRQFNYFWKCVAKKYPNTYRAPARTLWNKRKTDCWLRLTYDCDGDDRGNL